MYLLILHRSGNVSEPDPNQPSIVSAYQNPIGKTKAEEAATGGPWHAFIYKREPPNSTSEEDFGKFEDFAKTDLNNSFDDNESK
ncbi:hypothetical protein JTB14_016166 [Gonioctena quinquepunctata]|nr:hypothetical protein JTB14_016166 [Gonioctena quinquepunctata]